ncbi:unnamed protein product [Polarella glacialis]|uniref:WWE domain-containing protein n=1 Tax=Polarella glacialis TaxID=89957 RepID=A0A813E4B4_POLGL|nr:unnamed protein product [Polarella glacialis]
MDDHLLRLAFSQHIWFKFTHQLTWTFQSGMAVWFCKLKGSFHAYDPSIFVMIESAYQKGEVSTNVKINGVIYIIDFKRMKQIRQDDHHKQRDVARAGGSQKHLNPVAQPPRPSLPSGLETKRLGEKNLFHLTTEACAGKIMASAFQVSKPDPNTGYRPWFGEFIYFAGSPKDCEGKTPAGTSLETGALLKATVNLGTSLVLSDREPKAGVQQFLRISSWKDLTQSSLDKVACGSIYVTQPAVKRDEYAVPRAQQVRGLVLVGYKARDQLSRSSSPQLQPWWLWPQWVHELGAAIGVDAVEVDRVTEGKGSGTSAPVGTHFGVRVNSAGRPIYENGRFMSYAEARSRGWGGVQKASAQAPARLQIKPQPAPVRINCAGRPIHANRRFMSYVEAGSRGWGGVQKASAQAPARLQIKPQPAPVRINCAGRPIHANGRFMSYVEAGSRGWGGAAPGPSLGASPNSGGQGWNAFQASVGGQGFSKPEISSMYWAQK